MLNKGETPKSQGFASNQVESSMQFTIICTYLMKWENPLNSMQFIPFHLLIPQIHHKKRENPQNLKELTCMFKWKLSTLNFTHYQPRSCIPKLESEGCMFKSPCLALKSPN